MCCIFQAWTRVLAEYSCRLVTHTLMATFLEKLLKNWNSNRTWCFPDYPPSVPKLARWAVLPCSQLLMTGFLFSLFPTSKRRLRLVEMVRQCVSPPWSHLQRLGHHFLSHLSTLDILLFFFILVQPLVPERNQTKSESRACKQHTNCGLPA